MVSLCLSSKRSSVTNTIRAFHNFGLHILKVNKNHGTLYTVKYLKACQLAVQKKIAGQPLKSLRELEADLPLPRLKRSGLPGIIPKRDGRAICSSSSSVIRL